MNRFVRSLNYVNSSQKKSEKKKAQSKRYIKYASDQTVQYVCFFFIGEEEKSPRAHINSFGYLGNCFYLPAHFK